MSAYGHRLRKIAPDHYRMVWTVDFKYKGSRLRFPREMSRDTDSDGAARFAKKWKVPIPP